MKILIIRFSSLGDIVLTTPIVRALKLQMEDVEIHFCTKPQYQFLFADNPYVTQTHVLNSGLSNLISELRSEHFDLIIDLHHNLRTFIIKRLLAVRSRSFRKLNLEKWLKVKLKFTSLPNVHIVDRYMETVNPFGVMKDGQGLDYFIPEKDVVEKEWLPQSHQKSYVVYAIGGKYATKRMPVNKMIELCDKINKPIILLGGTEDQATAEELAHFFRKSGSSDVEEGLGRLNKKTTIFNGCGKFNVNQSASLIKNALVVFSHDTGLMHIAAAFKKQIYTIWGNTIPEFGMYPYKTSFVIFENKKLKCRPCSKIGFRHCPQGHFRCMNDLNFDFYIP